MIIKYSFTKKLFSSVSITWLYYYYYQACFLSRFYNSRFDSINNIDAEYPAGLSPEEKYDYVTVQAEKISNLSLALAQYLYTAATNTQMSEEILNKFQVQDS